MSFICSADILNFVSIFVIYYFNSMFLVDRGCEIQKLEAIVCSSKVLTVLCNMQNWYLNGTYVFPWWQLSSWEWPVGVSVWEVFSRDPYWSLWRRWPLLCISAIKVSHLHTSNAGFWASRDLHFSLVQLLGVNTKSTNLAIRSLRIG